MVYLPQILGTRHQQATNNQKIGALTKGSLAAISARTIDHNYDTNYNKIESVINSGNFTMNISATQETLNS